MDRTSALTCSCISSVSLNPYSNGIWIELFGTGGYFADHYTVLILILMEYGQNYDEKLNYCLRGNCLNPYSNGIWIELLRPRLEICILHLCLNPYSNGIWIELVSGARILAGHFVLILILMEYGQNSPFLDFSGLHNTVLILILMEYGQNVIYVQAEPKEVFCLNPYSNGIWIELYADGPQLLLNSS